jgi:hypothetical protein
VANAYIVAGVAYAIIAVVVVGLALGSVLPTNQLSLAPSFTTPIQHVVVVFLENAPISAVQSDGGYLWFLTGTYAYASNYYSPCFPSIPNYLTATSDSTQGDCTASSSGADAPPPSGGFGGANIFSEAQTAGLTWANYAQSMPKACDQSDSQPYVVHHTPALYYTSVISSSSTCAAHVLPFTTAAGLATASGFPENYVFVTPDNNNNKPVSASDSFAQSLISAMSSQSYWSSTVVFFVYDTSANTQTCPAGLDGMSTTQCGGHVYISAVSPYTKGVGNFATNADHYSLFQTSAWLLGLAQGSTGTAMKGLFNFGGSGSGLSASLSVSPSSIALGKSATFTATASGGSPPYSYSYAGLPTGCASANQAALSCTPSAAGTFNAKVTVGDASGNGASATATLTVTSSGTQVSISSFGATPSTVVLGNSTALAVVAAGGTGPYSYAYTGLPPGCSSGNAATLTCTPSQAGTYNVTVTVTASAGGSAQGSLALTVQNTTMVGTSGVTSGDLVIGLAGGFMAVAVIVTLLFRKVAVGAALLGLGTAFVILL